MRVVCFDCFCPYSRRAFFVCLFLRFSGFFFLLGISVVIGFVLFCN